jgi:hypothetical protein
MQGACKEDSPEDSEVTKKLSDRYECEIVETPACIGGAFNGIPYESVQAEILPEHIFYTGAPILRKFILSADLHLVLTRPAARLDPDWLDTQRQALRFLVSKAVENACPLVVVGDIFDHAKVGTEVVVMAIQEFSRIRSHEQEVYFLIGNHDAPGHDPDSIHEASLGILLEIFPQIPQIDGIQDAQPFGRDKDTGAAVVFSHQLVFKDESSRPPMAKGKTAQDLLDSLPSAQWVFVGDLHHSFDYKAPDGRRVVSPGNLIAHNASMIEVEAKCALIDLDALGSEVTWIEIPDDPAMLTRDHLDAKAAKVDRLAGFMERVKEAGGHTLTFKDKLEARMGLKDITEPQARAFRVVKARATEVEK